MKEFLKKNFVIVLAFALPFVFLIIFVLSVYLRSFFLSTNYNFVYLVCDSFNFSCRDLLKQYSVINGKIVISTINQTQNLNEKGITDIKEHDNVRIFLYDTKKYERQQITFKEAQELYLSEHLTSPDGFKISRLYDRDRDVFFFFFNFNSSYDGYYLVKGKIKRKLDLIDIAYPFYSDYIKFIGWVLPGRNKD